MRPPASAPILAHSGYAFTSKCTNNGTFGVCVHQQVQQYWHLRGMSPPASAPASAPILAHSWYAFTTGIRGMRSPASAPILAPSGYASTSKCTSKCTNTGTFVVCVHQQVHQYWHIRGMRSPASAPILAPSGYASTSKCTTEYSSPRDHHRHRRHHLRKQHAKCSGRV